MRTHPLNVSYLVVGLAFLGIAGSWALNQADVIGPAEVEWLLPLSLVIAGGIGLVAFMARSLRAPRATDTGDAEPTTYDHTYVDDEGDLR